MEPVRNATVPSTLPAMIEPKRSANGWYCGSDLGGFTKLTDPITVSADAGTQQCIGDVPFGDYVALNDVTSAEEILNEIEDRVLELKVTMGGRQEA